jgi:heparosan-N-sulfate-glucuronate 5-epimerase
VRLGRLKEVRGPGEPSIFSSARSFPTQVGSQIRQGEVGGYYFDLRFKAGTPSWTPPPARQMHVATAQWALGCYEHFLVEGDEAWLRAALAAGDFLIEKQQKAGRYDGALLHGTAVRHSYHLPAPWVSAMAQGEAASLFLRLYRETGEDRFPEAALRAMRPLRRSPREGGVRVSLDGGPFFEEYPTSPPSFVLNGAIFTLWGLHDVAVGLGDADAIRDFSEGVDALARNIGRWDTGYWSRYDLFPHPALNVASGAYHALHTTQLRAMQLIAPRREFEETADRFERYRRSRLNAARAFARKVAFRLVVPRNSLLAHRMPWSEWRRAGVGKPRFGSPLVLCYHALSRDWPAGLAIAPERLREQLTYLLRRGYRGATFGEVIRGEAPRKALVVTFDDAFRSVFDHGLPILDELGLPATIFVPTDFVGAGQMSWPGWKQHWVGTPHEDELTCVTWEDLRRLRAAGWEVGSHTRSHPVLTQLDEHELRAELVGSREVCARELGVSCASLAYPFGVHDERVRAAAREAGYEAAVTDRPGEVSTFSWPRIGVSAIDTPRRFRIKTSPSLRRVRNTRGARLLERHRGGLPRTSAR